MNCNLVSWIRFIKSRKLFIIYDKNLHVTKYKIRFDKKKTALFDRVYRNMLMCLEF